MQAASCVTATGQAVEQEWSIPSTGLELGQLVGKGDNGWPEQQRVAVGKLRNLENDVQAR